MKDKENIRLKKEGALLAFLQSMKTKKIFAPTA